MENRARLRVQKKKPIKRSGRKPLLKKVLDYLKSDTFMYAPLLSHSPSPNEFHFPTKVVELKRPVKERQWLRKQVGEYLKSNVYMYDPLLHPPHSPKETLWDCGMVRMDDSTRRLAMKVNQQTDHLGNAKQRSEGHLPQTDLSDQHTMSLRHTETVKHTVYQSCCSTSAPRIVTLNSQFRSLVD